MTTADIDHVADRNRVLEQDEQTGDDVLHQCLRSEADGEADDTGTGQQGRYVDADLRQGDETDYGDQQHHDGVPQQRQQGPDTGAALDPGAVAVAAGQVVLDQVGDDFPGDDGQKQHDADRDGTGTDALAERQFEPCEAVHAPGVEQRHQGEEPDDRLQHPLENRQVAVGALLQVREFAL